MNVRISALVLIGSLLLGVAAVTVAVMATPPTPTAAASPSA